MTNDELLSKTISYLRFPLTVGVVFIHFNLAYCLNIHGVIRGLGNPDWFFLIVYIISVLLPRIGVPLFFIISGFLFFYRKDFDKSVYTQKLKTRVRTLLIPFVLWNIIAIVWQLKRFLPGASLFYRPVVEVQLSFVRIINTFLCNVDNRGIFIGPPSPAPVMGFCPINGPLWYVRELMVMAVLSPIIYWLLKKAGRWFVIVMGLVWFFSSVILPRGNYAYIYMGMLPAPLFFFSLGAFYSIFKENIVLSFRKLKYASLIYIPIAIADICTRGLTCNEYIGKAGILVGIVAAVVLVSYLLEFGKVKVSARLANSSFFVFAFHRIFMEDVGRFAFTMLHIPENNPYAMLALYFAVPIFTILVCLALYVLLKRYAPKVCSLLTGGR
ncbi:MAG: acyltransferase [Prevotella sp.]|nr:acyltransferase [Prevotella sp.]